MNRGSVHKTGLFMSISGRNWAEAPFPRTAMTYHEDELAGGSGPAAYAGAGAHPLAVALLAESPLVCEALARSLRDVAQHCELSFFTSPEDLAARLSAGYRLDLVLIGDFLSAEAGKNLSAAARLIRAAGKGCPIVVVSAATDVPLQRELRDSGIRGHVSTRMPMSAAEEAVRLVMAGGTYIPNGTPLARPAARQPGNSDGGAKGLPSPSPENLGRHKLSPREYQVLLLLELGHSNRRIAAELGISENTVMVHLRHLMRKLGATNRTQAVFKANVLLAGPGPCPDP